MTHSDSAKTPDLSSTQGSAHTQRQHQKIEELRQLKERMRLGGGADKSEAQRKRGKMTAWERIEYLFDPGTFVEVGTMITLRNENFGLAKSRTPGDGVITGFGKVNGRTVYVSAQDFTVLGGSVGEMHGKKIAAAMNMASQNGAPFISLNDSGGARIQEGIGSLCAYGEVFFANTRASGVIPQISLIMGPCAGGAVYSPGITDFVVMVEGTSNMFITGPQVIKAVTNEEVSMEDLGGPEVHMSRSGVATKVCADDEAALDWVKRLLSYLPSNNLDPAPRLSAPTSLSIGAASSISIGTSVTPVSSTGAAQDSLEASLNDIIPESRNKAYDMFDVLKGIVDTGSFLELQEGFATNIIIGFARLGGLPIGIVANRPKELAGCLDVNASFKAARFVRFCDAFNIPLLTLVDVPGFLPGVEQEYGGIIRHGAKLLYAYSEATVPKLTVILRKAYGGAYICMCSKHLGADLLVAWPSAEIAVMGPEGAVNIVFKKEIESAEEPEKKRQECIDLYTEKFANPQMAASLGYVDDVIEPAETRRVLMQHLGVLVHKRLEGPKRKHGNIPL